MKKILIVIISSAFLLACGSQNKEDKTNENGEKTYEMQAPLSGNSTDVTANTDAASRLDNGVPELNNGAKWNADESTNQNVALLQDLVTDFEKKSNPNPADYKKFNERFTAGLSKMVQECKMKGPDHDALHTWLEPLMEDNKKLLNAGSEEVLKNVFDTISDRVSIYPNYFE